MFLKASRLKLAAIKHHHKTQQNAEPAKARVGLRGGLSHFGVRLLGTPRPPVFGGLPAPLKHPLAQSLGVGLRGALGNRPGTRGGLRGGSPPGSLTPH